MPQPTDAFYKKTIRFRHGGRDLNFRVAHDLFSSHDIDEGTRLLLRTLDAVAIAPNARILDLGCGYGPLGLTLAAAAPSRTVHLADRDALAVEYTRQNAAINGIEHATAFGSLAFDDVPAHDYDLIVSNIPAKAGESAVEHLLRAAGHHLADGGTAAVVVIARIAPLAARILESAGEIESMHVHAGATYTVFHYRFGLAPDPAFAPGSFDRGVYAAGSASVSIQGSPIETAADIDANDVATQLLVAAIAAAPRASDAVAFNPGNGPAALAIARVHQPDRLRLVDRDLLALRQSARNLVAGGFDPARIDIQHAVRLGGEPAQLIAGVVREDEGIAAVEQLVDDAAALPAPDGRIVLAGTSTGITRIERYVERGRELRVLERKRRRGVSVATLVRRASSGRAG